MRYHDKRFRFLDGNGREGLTGVRVFRREGDPAATVVVSALAENPGMSPCNAFEELAPQIAAAFDLDGRRLRYVEHWGPQSYADRRREEEFSVVRFSFDPDGGNRHAPGAGRFYNPRWTHATRADVEAMIGAELPPFPFEQSKSKQ